MRGLKLWVRNNLTKDFIVAPYTGAWIETLNSHCVMLFLYVAPYTGAWIETVTKRINTLNKESHPTRVRGLKRDRDRLV